MDRVEIEVSGGKTVSGTFSVKRGMITVSTVHGSKTTQVGQMNAKVLAEKLLRELADEGKV